MDPNENVGRKKKRTPSTQLGETREARQKKRSNTALHIHKKYLGEKTIQQLIKKHHEEKQIKNICEKKTKDKSYSNSTPKQKRHVGERTNIGNKKITWDKKAKTKTQKKTNNKRHTKQHIGEK